MFLLKKINGRSITVSIVMLLTIVTSISTVNGMQTVEAQSLDSLLAWASSDGEIYVWDGASGEVSNISNLSGWDAYPSWSMNGWLAWESHDGGRHGCFDPCTSDVMVWNPVTGEIIRIGQTQTNDYSPDWSEDGRLAWVSNDADHWEINIWNNAASEIQISTNAYPISLKFGDGQLAWEAAGDGISDIYVWDDISGDVINVSQSDSHEVSPIWSEDGRLAWMAECGGALGKTINRNSLNFLKSNLLSPELMTIREIRRQPLVCNGFWDIYVWDSASDTITNVSEHPAMDYGHTWSKDGRLAWVSERDGNMEIYVWDGTTGEITNVSQSMANDIYPVWSDDGRLAWSSEHNKDGAIYVFDPSNNELTYVSPYMVGSNVLVQLAWSASGQLAWSSLANGNRDIFVWDGTHEGVFNVSNNTLNDYLPGWWP